MTSSQIETFMLGLGEKKFRSVQLMKWIHHAGLDDFSEMTNFSKLLREKLHEVACIMPPEVVSDCISKDGTRKWVIRVASGSCIETVFIPQNDRGTLCVSSQAGCTLDCAFCSTGKRGFNSNLSSAEIIGQVWIACRALSSASTTINRAVTNVVLMGMGEPLLNYDAVIPAMKIMLDDLGYGISKRKVTLSTAGVVPMIDRLAGEMDVSLAVSLHAPNNALRNSLVPLNKKYPIEVLLESCKNYIQSLGKERLLTIEYTLLAGINDGLGQAKELAVLLEDIPCKINLIPFNPFDGTSFQRPSQTAITQFQMYLQRAGYNVTVRLTRGDDIDAACGQLVGLVEDKTMRQSRHLKAQSANLLVHQAN